LFQFRPQSKAVRVQMEAAGYRPKYEMLVPNTWLLGKVVGKLTTKWSGVGKRLRLRPQADAGGEAWADADYSLSVEDMSRRVGSGDAAVVLAYSWAATAAGKKRRHAAPAASDQHVIVDPQRRTSVSTPWSTLPTWLPPPSPFEEAPTPCAEVLYEGALGDETCMGLLSALAPPPEETVHLLVPKKKKKGPEARLCISTEAADPAALRPSVPAFLPAASATAAQPRVKKRIAPTLVTAPRSR
jgi:hypothetical protein